MMVEFICDIIWLVNRRVMYYCYLVRWYDVGFFLFFIEDKSLDFYFEKVLDFYWVLNVVFVVLCGGMNN